MRNLIIRIFDFNFGREYLVRNRGVEQWDWTTFRPEACKFSKDEADIMLERIKRPDDYPGDAFCAMTNQQRRTAKAVRA